MNTYITDLVFADIAEAFDEVPRCRIREADHRCERPAGFFAVCHGCGRGFVCVPHLRAFVEQLQHGDVAQCNKCGRMFATIDDAMSVMPL